MTDIFKTKPKAFLDSIYGNALGQIRSDNIISDLSNFLKEHKKIKKVLDIGAGSAPVTFSILQKYPELKACLVEPSKELLEKAKENREHFDIKKERATYFEGNLDEFLKVNKEKYDLIICHAVINWVKNPKEFTEKIINMAGKNTYISLVFGSSTAKALRFAHQGNVLDLVKTIESPGTPVLSLIGKEKVQPLSPDQVLQWINKNCTISFKAGIRIFSDYVKPSLLGNADFLEKLKKAETMARTNETYWKLGQLIHYIFHKK